MVLISLESTQFGTADFRLRLDFEWTRRCRLSNMDTTQDQLTIQEAAEVTDLSVHTLRYYERIGLLMPVGRAANGHRRYSQQDTRFLFLGLTRIRFNVGGGGGGDRGDRGGGV